MLQITELLDAKDHFRYKITLHFIHAQHYDNLAHFP